MFFCAQGDATDLAVLHMNLLTFGLVTEGHARLLAESAQTAGQLAHTAFDRPDTVHFDLCNQAQGGGGFPGRRPAVSGVAGKQLTHAGVLELLLQAFPQGLHRAQARQQGQAPRSQ